MLFDVKIENSTTKDIQENLIIGEFWTAKQRQGNRLHEISYRACFKPPLVEYFLRNFSQKGDYVYDPFGGRGTTAIQSALMHRIPISNDINPLSRLLTEPRLDPPTLSQVEYRLEHIYNEKSPSLSMHNDLYMFYHDHTFRDILILKDYLKNRNNEEDFVDRWIRMVATSRLSGHSKGFFSVYTLPPNQAASKKRQLKINKDRNQIPEYRDVKILILKKSKVLLSGIDKHREILQEVNKKKIILSEYSHDTKAIKSNSVSLIITSPPFMNIVDYIQDNWLRCWFNDIDTEAIRTKMTNSSKLVDWENEMLKTLIELKRVLQYGGKIAFEVGEIQKGKIKLDESIVKLSKNIGLTHLSTLVNQQKFTKTSNIWGIKNNAEGTNTNRIVLLQK